MRTEFFDNLRRGLKVRGGGEGRTEVRIGNDVLLLNRAVVTHGGEHIGQRKAIVESAKTRAEHGLGPRILRATSGGPGDSYPGSEVAPIMDVGLGFITQAYAHRNVGPDPPVVAEERADILLM